MKQVVDQRGSIVEGIYRNNDGSLTINNSTAYQKNRLQHEKFSTLTSEVELLKEQVNKILEKLNGS